MAMRIMVQGTMSGAGKSLLVTALCRIFAQDGYRVAPFKSQNMALNSFITKDGGEMGRAQVVQAYASGKEPDVRMNPILLKPSSDVGSQVIVHGHVRGDYRAADYFKMKRTLIPDILAAYRSLESENDIIVIEGAGSPAEINLKQDDIVNMGLAELVDAPVLLVGDIDPGGVFAQLCGTVMLLEERERRRIVGTIINKFRGDVSLLEPGLRMLEDLTHVPVLGVVPYTKVDLDDEDSVSPRLERRTSEGAVDIAVIRLPHISNFTDFIPLERHPALGVRYVDRAKDLGAPSMVILPGSKNTMDDLQWLRETVLAEGIVSLCGQGTPVLGICGGYQMLGAHLADPDHVEHGGEMDGLGLLPCRTVFQPEKIQTQVSAVVKAAPFAGAELEGYQIHMGQTTTEAEAFSVLSDGTEDGAVQGNVFGTYLHGLFDSGSLTTALADWLLRRNGMEPPDIPMENHRAHQERQLNLLADVMRRSLDMPAIYRAMEEYGNG